MRHYCTLFDYGYAPKGLALHESLMQHSSEPFMLHILAMDIETMWLLAELNLPNVDVIPIDAFERAMNLRQVRESRTWPEYCWTAASNFMEYLLGSFASIDALTYLDSDVFFFAEPELIFLEIGDEHSIGITPHRFTEKTPRHVMNNGRFNVGVLYARNDETGFDCISRWAAKCRDWCYAKVEADRFGDQKYLDCWPLDYPGRVAIIEHPGINLGPWALGNYRAFANRLHQPGSVRIVDGQQPSYPLVAYHFHEYRDPQWLTGWPLRPIDRELIYAPYSEAWARATERIDEARRRIAARRQSLEFQAERV